MPKNHTVVQADHIAKIAEKYHFFDYTIIWDDGANADVKSKRTNPNILYPGDVVVIPDKTPKTETRPTTRTYTFKVKPQPLQVRLQIFDYDGEPAVGDFKFKIEGDSGSQALTDGKFRKPISRAWENGSIRFDKLNILDIPMKIGWLDPVEYQSGQVARLNNLGYNAGVVESPDALQFRSAVEEFQCDNGLDVTGTCDADTQAKLKEVHQC
ncbi:peptidoglycan-binding domain-containing protein [uncultured Paludibaculum sp.]|uniref:peptidoglycan-binding domain-containing protein n=1 Tax=uncultured Paludibaculum sp. TaxID=1765020 RepID=UPI002AAB9ED0|nr:peptidoglycan-binding domain-containing protein [uncultured Paludibaculum sp.]